jgi:aminomethyltransferase
VSKQTVLHDTHVSLGARMVDFAGWHMPIQYAEGISHEHLAVRNAAGIFDVSHMGQIRVQGPDAVPFLQFAALNDAGRLRTGRAHYSMLANDRGGLIDDIYVYRDGPEDFMVVTNASNHTAALLHLQSLASAYDLGITDEIDRWALLAVQGPEAVALLERVTGADLQQARKNSTVEAELHGAALRLTRTGYTGEDGFEVFCAPEAALGVWQALVDEGAVPCGLGARDSLRLEAGFPLFGNELTDSTNPLCTPVSWLVKDKPFYGRDAIWARACPRRLVGLKLTDRGIPRHGYPVLHDGMPIGEVSSGTVSPFTREAIALAWLDTAFAATGTEVAVEIRNRPVSARVTELPFLKR